MHKLKMWSSGAKLPLDVIQVEVVEVRTLYRPVSGRLVQTLVTQVLVARQEVVVKAQRVEEGWIVVVWLLRLLVALRVLAVWMDCLAHVTSQIQQ